MEVNSWHCSSRNEFGPRWCSRLCTWYELQFYSFFPSDYLQTATRKLAKKGDGSTPQSCISCDPTHQYCVKGCQKLIDRVYRACDNTCLPDGYFYDPSEFRTWNYLTRLSEHSFWTFLDYKLSGCWEKNLKDMKIAVERCGCNGASSIPFDLRIFASVIGFAVLVLLYLWSQSYLILYSFLQCT